MTKHLLKYSQHHPNRTFNMKIGRKGKSFLLLIIGILLLFSSAAYGVGAFIFMMFPKTFEPFVTMHPFLSHFGKLFVGWIVCGILTKIFK
jgi:hypothetical protein